MASITACTIMSLKQGKLNFEPTNHKINICAGFNWSNGLTNRILNRVLLPHQWTLWMNQNTLSRLWVNQHIVARGQGRFPFSQNFRFNRLKCKWNAGFQRKFSGTDGQPSELLHFFRCNRSERKHAVPFARRRDFSRHFQCPVSRRSLTYL